MGITPKDPADFDPSMGDYKDLRPFRFWCQKALPLVYDDSLSYYEVLCKLVDYLNKTMEDVGVLHDDVDALHTAYQQLQSYVNNYFSTLDVQQEINNKLDVMASDGTLDALLLPYFNAYKNEINGIVANQNTSISTLENTVNGAISSQNGRINVLSERMDTFSRLAEGSTTGDAELADIRVGANGVTYNTAGDAVRGQTIFTPTTITSLSEANGITKNMYIPTSDGSYSKKLSVTKPFTSYGCILSNSFTIAASTTHSSESDCIFVNFKKGEEYYIDTNVGDIYFHYTDGTSEEVDSVGTSTKDVMSVGIYYENTSGSNVGVYFTVYIGSNAVALSNSNFASFSSNYFVVPANTNHSSTLDRISVNIKQGEKYYVEKNLGSVYFFYADGTSAQVSSDGVASKDVVSVGIYYENQSGNSVTIHFLVIKDEDAIGIYRGSSMGADSGIYTKYIHITSGSSHSAYNDQLLISISAGEKYYIESTYGTIYAFYDDSTYGTVSGLNTASKNIIAFGLSSNPAASDVDAFMYLYRNDHIINMYQASNIAKNASVLTKMFTIPENTAHSSTKDKIDVNIKQGQSFYVFSNVGSSFVFYSDGTYAETAGGIAAKDITSIGIYYQTSGSSVDVEFTVIYGSKNIDLYTGDVVNYGDSKILEFTDLFVGSESMDSYFFYTDPHFLGGGNYLLSKQKTKVFEYLSVISRYAAQCDPSIIIGGGDYLNQDDTMKQASYKLNFLKGITDKYFPRKNYYQIIGNHDTNYQGIEEQGSDPYTGKLTQDTLNNILYRESDTKKSYFTIDSSNTRYYCFDTGVDNDDSIIPYRQEQLNWFANSLTSDNSNIALIMHIFSNDISLDTTGAHFGDYITTFAENIMDIVNAYNNRTSITVDDVEYNYASATGKIWFVHCGHTHYDYVYTDDVIPVICTRNATNYGNGDIQFDMVFIDYTNEIVDLIRVGSGNNRTVNI